MKNMDVHNKTTSLCGYCDSPVQTTRGVDQRFINDQIFGWRSECSNDDCIKSPTFTRGDFESSLEAWNTFWATHKNNV